MTDNEQRQFTRVHFAAPARLVSSAGIWTTTMVDISLKGALVQIPESWPGKQGDKYILEFTLSGSSVVIRMSAEVAHITGGYMGMACLQMDLDSVSHLKRLVELNIGDPELLERELEHLDLAADR